jgi:hypothetical protein
MKIVRPQNMTGFILVTSVDLYQIAGAEAEEFRRTAKQGKHDQHGSGPLIAEPVFFCQMKFGKICCK